MKKFLFSFLFLFSTFAFSQTFSLTKENIPTFNRVSWALKGNGQYHTIQNVSGKTLRLDLWVDKVIAGTANTPSDNVYILCGEISQPVSAGTGIICDIPYPGLAIIADYPYVNGVTGQFSIHY
ncbi:hypothetical protein SCO11_13575 [Legionella pneumophila serogroup 1]|uniref:hypothetical protein n=1 Tax=Legionella pneumophila TaxID=446 RepID=UPI0005B45930|nr:hypothetical protein [Legionella pneumophila]AMV14982.1 hypothetical protein ULM_23170 [Legionella pneumophila]ANN93148.1 hypothetical protein A9P85_11170 [Legionella pneumophila]MCH9060674.1 hypothetical protein [Legionella pneumophila serogroup 1]MCH9063536.1 hypothetical protein [Legionella pneumophila serogroup 1]MCH9066424.1 hypothetical protein [Legionella pneumophila serogroup 1]